MSSVHFGVANDNTAAGYSDSPSTYFKWKIHQARVSITTSASVGNRQIRLFHGPANGQGEVLLDTGLVAAGTTKVVTGGLSAVGEVSGNHTQWAALISIATNEKLNLNVAGLLAGDTYTWDIMLEEHLATEDAD